MMSRGPFQPKLSLISTITMLCSLGQVLLLGMHLCNAFLLRHADATGIQTIMLSWCFSEEMNIGLKQLLCFLTCQWSSWRQRQSAKHKAEMLRMWEYFSPWQMVCTPCSGIWKKGLPILKAAWHLPLWDPVFIYSVLCQILTTWPEMSHVGGLSLIFLLLLTFPTDLKCGLETVVPGSPFIIVTRAVLIYLWTFKYCWKSWGWIYSQAGYHLRW